MIFSNIMKKLDEWIFVKFTKYGGYYTGNNLKHLRDDALTPWKLDFSIFWIRMDWQHYGGRMDFL